MKPGALLGQHLTGARRVTRWTRVLTSSQNTSQAASSSAKLA